MNIRTPLKNNMKKILSHLTCIFAKVFISNEQTSKDVKVVRFIIAITFPFMFIGIGIVVFNACQKDESISQFSCNKGIEQQIQRSIGYYSNLSREEWKDLPDELKIPVYRTFSSKDKYNFWIEKQQEVLQLEWTNKEIEHIEMLFSIFEGNFSFFEDGYVEGNEKELKRVKYFVNQWENYAITELNWNRTLIYALCASGDDVTKIIRQIEKGEYTGTREGNGCGCSQKSDYCDIMGDLNGVVSCQDGPDCKASASANAISAATHRGLFGGCGFFWLFKCNGICRGPYQN